MIGKINQICFVSNCVVCNITLQTKIHQRTIICLKNTRLVFCILIPTLLIYLVILAVSKYVLILVFITFTWFIKLDWTSITFRITFPRKIHQGIICRLFVYEKVFDKKRMIMDDQRMSTRMFIRVLQIKSTICFNFLPMMYPLKDTSQVEI